MSSHYYCWGGVGRHQPHFLHACSLCGKPLGFNSDIFMYRGNSPFCSKECRQEQIELDEAEEKKMRKVSSSARSVRKSESKNSTTSKTLPTGTVAVA